MENIIDLIDGSESLDYDDKKYWKDILPSLEEVDKEELIEILENEKRKLKELDEKYKDYINNLN